MLKRCLILVFMLITASTYAKTILVLGDSLSAAYGIDKSKGWVNLLKERLNEQSYSYRVINDSTSGDTTSDGLRKLPEALVKHKPEIIIIELGANDGLRGLPISIFKANLEKLIIQAHLNSAKVLLLATLLPPNHGEAYLVQYKQVYVELAQKYHTRFIPMFLEGVAGDSKWMQPDGLHPNQKAQLRILNNIWPVLQQML